MNYNLCYNEFSYIDSICKGDTPMTLNSILERHSYPAQCKRYTLTGKTSAYLNYIEKSPFFISSELNLVKESGQDTTPSLIIMSAPGAVGKSTLAKYLAASVNALYWDLSELTIGTDTFQGSIVSAVGPAQLGSFMQDLADSKVIIAFDAFDEAEMISGRKMIGEFVIDMANSLKKTEIPCAILFARTTTAQFLAAFCESNDISFNHYEIGYFNDCKSVEFVTKYARCLDVNNNNNISEALVTEYFKKLKEFDFCDTSFTGYAPTLQMITKHIVSDPNTVHVVNELSAKTVSELVCHIMTSLLEREHQLAVEAVKRKCAAKYPEFTDWDTLYTPEEQIVRLLSLILFHTISYSDWEINGIPASLVDDYESAISRQLVQHPFLLDVGGEFNFAGPAFKDFVLAFSMLHEQTLDAATLFLGEESDRYLPSTVFFDCFSHMVADNALLSSINLLYKSFCASSHVEDRKSLAIYEESDDLGKKTYTITFYKEDATILTLAIPVGNKDILHFESIFNVTIDAPDLEVSLGSSTAEARVANSTIVCRRVVWKSRTTTIDVAPDTESLIVASEGMHGESIFYCNINGTLRICAPNISNYYKLLTYAFDYSSESSTEDILCFAHRVRCILLYFRTHGKDTLGKTADFVNNIIVGSSKPKRMVLDFLIESGIIYRNRHLFKGNMDLLGEAGINFSSILAADTNAYHTLFSRYLEYSKSQSTL